MHTSGAPGGGDVFYFCIAIQERRANTRVALETLARIASYSADGEFA